MLRFVATVLFLSLADCAKILGIFMTPSYSHQIVYQPIWKELSLRGHQVTVYTPIPLNDPTLTNLTEIKLRSIDYWKDTENITSERSTPEDVLGMHSELFKLQIVQPEMQRLIANPDNDHFDLFLVEYLYPGYFPFKDVYKCPMVGIISLTDTMTPAELIGMTAHPVLNPRPFFPFATNLTFIEKVQSTIFHMVYRVVILFMIPKFNSEIKQYFGEKTRNIGLIAWETSLILGNSNFAIQNIRPKVPAFVEIAGIHLQPQKPLPKDLQEFLDDAKDGAIYFSLGSSVQTHLVDKRRLEVFLSAFSELPYKVLWKYEKNDFENLSKNVEIRKWVPQQDILKHPNVKLFITQGGIQSIDEAINSTVPMLMVPIFVDQHFNANKMVNSGAGLSADLNTATKEELLEKINKIISNSEYKRTMEKLAAIAYDQPMPALEKAIWWIEYVLRHNGAYHLKYKGVGMPFYEYYLLDVYLFLAVIIFIVIYTSLKIVRIVIRISKYGYRRTKSILFHVDLKKRN